VPHRSFELEESNPQVYSGFSKENKRGGQESTERGSNLHGANKNLFTAGKIQLVSEKRKEGIAEWGGRGE